MELSVGFNWDTYYEPSMFLFDKIFIHFSGTTQFFDNMIFWVKLI